MYFQHSRNNWWSCWKVMFLGVSVCRSLCRSVCSQGALYNHYSISNHPLALALSPSTPWPLPSPARAPAPRLHHIWTPFNSSCPQTYSLGDHHTRTPPPRTGWKVDGGVSLKCLLVIDSIQFYDTNLTGYLLILNNKKSKTWSICCEVAFEQFDNNCEQILVYRYLDGKKTKWFYSVYSRLQYSSYVKLIHFKTISESFILIPRIWLLRVWRAGRPEKMLQVFRSLSWQRLWALPQIHGSGTCTTMWPWDSLECTLWQLCDLEITLKAHNYVTFR